MNIETKFKVGDLAGTENAGHVGVISKIEIIVRSDGKTIKYAINGYLHDETTLFFYQKISQVSPEVTDKSL